MDVLILSVFGLILIVIYYCFCRNFEVPDYGECPNCKKHIKNLQRWSFYEYDICYVCPHCKKIP